MSVRIVIDSASDLPKSTADQLRLIYSELSGTYQSAMHAGPGAIGVAFFENE